MDDLVYHGSLVAFHKNQLDRRADDMPLNDTALYHYQRQGLGHGRHRQALGRLNAFYVVCSLSGGSPLVYGDQGTEQGLCVLFLYFAKKLTT